MKWLGFLGLCLLVGCVSVVVQQGEKNAVERQIDVNRDKDKEERKP